ncbi:MAG: helix-turn-helix domain-containing protein [Candidatus Entotheonellia bacterium]
MRHTTLPPPTEADDFLTVDEVARQLRVQPKTVRAWLAAGALPGFKLAHKTWRITRADLQAFLAASRRGDTSADGGPEDTPPQRKARLVARLQALHAQGLSHQAIATQLSAEGVPTLSGKGTWQKGSVGHLLAQGD